jgi:predicted O-linked N-acetylglucosamine transferase (SPINDLY family)
MDEFMNLFQFTGYPNFHTHYSPQIYDLGIRLYSSHLEPAKKELLLLKLIYLYPKDADLYYKMACLFKNVSYEKQLMWHKICYAQKPQHFENLFDLCKLLYDHNEFKSLTELNVDNVFDKFNLASKKEFLQYYITSQRNTTNIKDVLKYSVQLVNEEATVEPTTLDGQIEKIDNIINIVYSYYALGNIPKSIENMENIMELAHKYNLPQNEKIKYHQLYVSLHDYLFYDSNAYYKKFMKINEYIKDKPLFTFTPTNKPKIRIGYVSSDFMTHAVTNFILPILKYHNRNKFEIFLYSNSFNLSPHYSQLNVSIHNIMDKDDEQAAELIHSHSIDILIDLNGNTVGNRLALFALHPAPIQMTYLGYPNTTGLKSIQYRITDQYADNMDSKQKYSEKLLKLPACFLLFESIQQQRPFMPKKLEDTIILGSLNKEAKNTKMVLDTWNKILNRCPNTKLIIKLDTFDNYDERLAYYKKQLNVSQDRLILYTKLDDKSYIELFSKVDILLDTFPYSGTTTSCNALYNSVPIITLYNKDYHVTNVTSSILLNCGIYDLISYSPDDYVTKAVELINQPSRINEYKKTLYTRFMNVMNPKLFMNSYEHLLTEKYYAYANQDDTNQKNTNHSKKIDYNTAFSGKIEINI